MSSSAPSGRGLSSVGVDLNAAIGGPRGIIESSVPGTLFVLAYTVTHELSTALWVSTASAAALIVARLVRRQTVQHAVAGLLGIGIGALIAWATGSARNFFFPSLIRNPAFAVIYAGSILARWPLVGVFAGAILGESPAEWRADPARMRAYRRATWLWVAMFAVRFAIQLPFYLQDKVTSLGTANILLGLPLYALVLLATWQIVRKPKQVEQPEDVDRDPEPSSSTTAGTPGGASSTPV